MTQLETDLRAWDARACRGRPPIPMAAAGGLPPATSTGAHAAGGGRGRRGCRGRRHRGADACRRREHGVRRMDPPDDHADAGAARRRHRLLRCAHARSGVAADAGRGARAVHRPRVLQRGDRQLLHAWALVPQCLWWTTSPPVSVPDGRLFLWTDHTATAADGSAYGWMIAQASGPGAGQRRAIEGCPDGERGSIIRPAKADKVGAARLVGWDVHATAASADGSPPRNLENVGNRRRPGGFPAHPICQLENVRNQIRPGEFPADSRAPGAEILNAHDTRSPLAGCAS